jgi:hypothetical protein
MGAYGMDQEFYPRSPIVTRPILRWPDNARVALAVIVNLEHWDWEVPARRRCLYRLVRPLSFSHHHREFDRWVDAPSEGCGGWRVLERQSHRRSFAITMLTARKEHVRKTSVDRAISIMTAVTAARI